MEQWSNENEFLARSLGLKMRPGGCQRGGGGSPTTGESLTRWVGAPREMHDAGWKGMGMHGKAGFPYGHLRAGWLALAIVLLCYISDIFEFSIGKSGIVRWLQQT